MSVEASKNNKRIAKNTLLLYFRMLLIMAVSLYTSRIVLRTLGVEDFGIYNVVGGFVSMFAVVSGAMTTATQRFISFEIGKGRNGNVTNLFSTVVIIHVILALIVLLLGETIGLWFLNKKMVFANDRYLAANWVFQFSLFSFIINVISVPYNAAIVAYEKMKAFAYVGIFETVLKLLIVYLIALSPFDKLIFYSFLLACVAISVRIIYGIYVRHHFRECICNYKFDWKKGKSIFSFVSWNLLGASAQIGKEQGLNVLLNLFFGASVNASRGIAYQVTNAVSQFVGNFQIAMNPQIVKLYASEQKEEMYNLVCRGSRLSFMLILCFAVPIIVETPFILHIWLGEIPEHSIVFLRIVMTMALIDSLSHTLIACMHASGKVRLYQIINSTFLFFTLPLSYFILKMGFPAYSAFIVSLLISCVCHIVRLGILNKTIGFPISRFLKDVTCKSLFLSVFCFSIPCIIRYNIASGILISIGLIAMSFILTIICCYYIGLNYKEKVFVYNKFKDFFKKIR